MQKNQDVVAIYSRKSRFTGKGESIGNQVELCRDHIRTAFGGAYADHAAVFEDEGFSGGNLNRPGFQKMMRAAREHQFKAVVVYRLDRISRNIGDFSNLIEELGRLGIDFVSIRERFDTSSPMGRAMMYIASVFSQLERETIAERIRDNMHELAKTGRWLGGVTPTGYASESIRSVAVDGKSKKACKLKLIPEEAEIVRKIYDLYRETGSLTRTETELLRAQIKTKTGRDFTRFSIKAILQNPVYLISDGDAYRYFADRQAEVFSDPEEFDGVRGILAYNRTDQEKGRAAVLRPVREWIVSVGQHPGIIPSRIWISVQQSLERNGSKAYRRPRRNTALLTGLLWCCCGGRMYPKLTNRVTDGGEPRYTYVCKEKERSRGERCSCRNADGNQLDSAVEAWLECLEEDSGRFLARLEEGKRGCSGGGEPCGDQLTQLRQQRTEIGRKIEALVDALAGFESGASMYIQRRIEQLHEQDTRLRERIAEREKAADRPALSSSECERLLKTFRERRGGMTVEQRRLAIRAVVCRVEWDGQHARVVLFGAAEKDQGPLCEDSK